ncbi:TPA: efflux transporter periplasmic adaptor subunit [Candidatus Azambacteria bacterium]|nr:efflux transporter periplasmic adaptor subunit [Candidatus Azambacteria bacterium]
MFKRMLIMLIVAGLIFGGIFAYKAVVNHYMNQYFDTMPMPVATITATEVTTAQWQPFVSAVGSFAAINSAELSTEASGIITSIQFDNASEVRKGQLLITLDDSVDQADFTRLKAAQQLAELELDRLQTLLRDKGVSELDVRRRESKACQAKAAVASQLARIAQKTIHAPFDGVTGIRQVSLGQLVSPGDNVVSLQSLDPIYLNFSLPEQQLASISPGQQLNVNVDAWADQQFSGEITAIAPAVRQSSRSVEVQATFANPQHKLRPGMFARVQMDAGQSQEVTLVPQTAIQFNPYGNSVFLIRDQDGKLTAHQRFVSTGQSRGDLIAITDGLNAGDVVATSGLLKLRNGAQVKISDNQQVTPTADPKPSPANQ